MCDEHFEWITIYCRICPEIHKARCICGALTEKDDDADGSQPLSLCGDPLPDTNILEPDAPPKT